LKPADAVSRVIPDGSIFWTFEVSWGLELIFCEMGFGAVSVFVPVVVPLSVVVPEVVPLPVVVPEVVPLPVVVPEVVPLPVVVPVPVPPDVVPVPVVDDPLTAVVDPFLSELPRPCVVVVVFPPSVTVGDPFLVVFPWPCDVVVVVVLPPLGAVGPLVTWPLP
jgi:hypothetical protein